MTTLQTRTWSGLARLTVLSAVVAVFTSSSPRAAHAGTIAKERQIANAASTALTLAQALATDGRATRGASGSIQTLLVSSDDLICDAWIIAFRQNYQRLVVFSMKKRDPRVRRKYDALIRQMSKLRALVELSCQKKYRSKPKRGAHPDIDPSDSLHKRCMRKCAEADVALDAAVDAELRAERKWMAVRGRRMIELEALNALLALYRSNLASARRSLANAHRAYPGRHAHIRPGRAAILEATKNIVKYEAAIAETKAKIRKVNQSKLMEAEQKAKAAHDKAVKAVERARKAWWRCIERWLGKCSGPDCDQVARTTTRPRGGLEGNWRIEWRDTEGRLVDRAALTLAKPYRRTCASGPVADLAEADCRVVHVRQDDRAWKLWGYWGDGYQRAYSDITAEDIDETSGRISHPHFVLGYWGGESSFRLVDPNTVRGTWKYRDESGTEVWHRVAPSVSRVVVFSDIESEARRAEGTPTAKLVYAPNSWGPHNRMRGNRPSFKIHIFGDDLWGHHLIDLGGDPRLEVLAHRPIVTTDADGAVGGIIGLEVEVVIWPEARPGRKKLFVDGIEIPFDLVVEGHPRASLVEVVDDELAVGAQPRVTTGRRAS